MHSAVHLLNPRMLFIGVLGAAVASGVRVSCESGQQQSDHGARRSEQACTGVSDVGQSGRAPTSSSDYAAAEAFRKRPTTRSTLPNCGLLGGLDYVTVSRHPALVIQLAGMSALLQDEVTVQVSFDSHHLLSSALTALRMSL